MSGIAAALSVIIVGSNLCSQQPVREPDLRGHGLWVRLCMNNG